MAGRHRKPPAWRRLLSSMFRSRHAAQRAALLAEVRELREIVARLHRDLDIARTEAAAAAASAQARWLTLPIAEAEVPLDRGEDKPVTEIVLAGLPEAALLDAKASRAEGAIAAAAQPRLTAKATPPPEAKSA